MPKKKGARKRGMISKAVTEKHKMDKIRKESAEGEEDKTAISSEPSVASPSSVVVDSADPLGPFAVFIGLRGNELDDYWRFGLSELCVSDSDPTIMFSEGEVKDLVAGISVCKEYGGKGNLI